MKRLLQLALVALVVHAGWRSVPVFWNYLNFRDGVAQTAKFSGGKSDAEVLQRILELAQAFGVPVGQDAIALEQTPDRSSVRLSYAAPLELLPGYAYPWEFKVDVEEPRVTVSQGEWLR